jgi:hypothetical protein
MTVTTRFRDIPFAEAQRCFRVAGPEPSALWELLMRDSEVTIHTPAVTENPNLACEGPYFAVVCGPHKVVVCPHIAEIGD